MKETKLDNFVGRIFNAVENATAFLLDENKKRKVFLRISLLQIFIGLTFIFLLFLSPNNPNEPVIFQIFTYLQIPGLIVLPLYLLYKQKFLSDIDLKILKFSQRFYSTETTKLCFEPIIADWKMEYSRAILQNKNWQARWVSIRYAYAFIAALIQQSWVGRFFDFFQRIFK